MFHTAFLFTFCKITLFNFNLLFLLITYYFFNNLLAVRVLKEERLQINKKNSYHLHSTWFRKECTKLFKKDYNLISRNKLAFCCQSYFEKGFTGFETKESLMSNHNLTGNSHSCLIITLTVIKQNLEQFIFYWNDFCWCGKSCFINSKYFGIYELNVKQTKFVNLNIVLLNENTGTLFNVLNLIKFPFRIIVLREHKIRLNSPISNINSSPFVIIKWKVLTVEKTSL